MTKRVLVVGGGVVGITAAYFNALKGNKVTLIEASNEIGGLLKSSSSTFGHFDYGVHIASRTGQPELDDFLFSQNSQSLHSFTLQEAGSFFNGQLTSFSPFLNLNSLNGQHKKNAGYELIKAPTNIEADNLATALKIRYGETAYKEAFEPYIKHTFGVKPSELPIYYMQFFDMYRVVAFDEKTSSAVKGIEYLNDRIAFQKPTPGVEKYYPKTGGIAYWVKGLYKQILSLGVDVILNTTVKSIEYNDKNISVKFDDNEHCFNEIDWTISSAILPHYLPLNNNIKKPNFRKTVLLDFVFQEPILTQCKYINNFSPTHLSTRLTCYQNLLPDSTFYAITVEVLVETVKNSEDLLNKISTELTEMGLVSQSNTCIFSQHRSINEGFPIITREIDSSIKKLNAELLSKYPNIKLLGRSSSKGFFMSELLIDTYMNCK
jgi:protoporphyrinogen oxidase